MSTKWSIWNWISVLILVGFFLTAKLLFWIQDSKLNSCSVVSKGLVYKRINSGKRMPQIWYKYKVNGIQYQSSESLERGNVYHIGDSIPIRYYCDDPSVCAYLRKK